MHVLQLALIIITMTAFSQEYEVDKAAAQEVSKIKFLEGNWSGSGWMFARDGTKHEFKQTEKVSFKLDNTALLIEGMGKSEGEVIHNALAIITYNQESGHYNFNSWLSSGLSGQYKAELIENDLYWYPNEYIRYIITIDAEGQWFETGEMKRGDDWMQFFEMTLSKN